ILPSVLARPRIRNVALHIVGEEGNYTRSLSLDNARDCSRQSNVEHLTLRCPPTLSLMPPDLAGVYWCSYSVIMEHLSYPKSLKTLVVREPRTDQSFGDSKDELNTFL